MAAFARILVWLSTAGLLHVAYSTYEYLSILKALDKPEGSIPTDIVIQAFVVLLLFLVGTVLNEEFIPITWASEMSTRTIDEMNSRSGFANFNHRAKDVLTPL